MKFETAIYKNKDEEYIIYRSEIEGHEKYDEVVKNLYCPEDGCNAKLIFNRRRPVGYLSKHISYDHVEHCRYFESGYELIFQRDFDEISGNLSDKGIKRRKNAGLKKLLELISPEDEKQKNKAINSPSSKKRERTSKLQKEKRAKINFNPESSETEEEISEKLDKVIGPRFNIIFPHQLSIERDSNRNLNVSGLIKQVTVNEEKMTAEIDIQFMGILAKLILPNVFFESDLRSVVPDQQLDFLKILAKYIYKNPETLYITTLCQSGNLKEEGLHLYIFDPTFPLFTLVNNPSKQFELLDGVAAAIATGAI